MQTFEVSTSEEFRNAVNAINNADSGSYEIKLKNDITLNDKLTLSKNTTTILGEGHTLISTQDNVLGADGTAVLNLGAENYSETLTLDGVASYINGSLLTINGNAILNMYNHVTLQNNSSSSSSGGVQVGNHSTFNMHGGTIRKCSSGNNTDGGGIGCSGGTVNITGGSLCENNARFGGGIYANGGTVNITGGSLCENNARFGSAGGAVYMSGGSLNITGGSICKNTASHGGGIYLHNSPNVSIQNCTITDNNSEGGGGGIYLHDSPNVSIRNCTITDNNAAAGGGGIYLYASPNVSIRNCTITDNNAAVGGIYLIQSSSVDLSGTGNVVCNNIACDIYLNSANDKLKLFDAASMNRTYRDSGKKIDGWYDDVPLYVPSEDAEAVDVSSELTGHLALVASYRISQEPEIPDGGDAGGGDADGAGSVLGSVVAGTAIGVGGYLVGTDFWLNTLYGFVPTNRIQLAEALWNRADCPAPQSNALYSDIAEDDSDAQQAARWCVEQDLMKDCTRTEQDGTETVIFKPYGYVFRPQAIGAWYQLDSLLKERT